MLKCVSNETTREYSIFMLFDYSFAFFGCESCSRTESIEIFIHNAQGFDKLIKDTQVPQIKVIETMNF